MDMNVNISLGNDEITQDLFNQTYNETVRGKKSEGIEDTFFFFSPIKAQL